MERLKLKGNLFVPKNLGNKETNSSIPTDQSTKYLVVEIINCPNMKKKRGF